MWKDKHIYNQVKTGVLYYFLFNNLAAGFSWLCQGLQLLLPLSCHDALFANHASLIIEMAVILKNKSNHSFHRLFSLWSGHYSLFVCLFVVLLEIWIVSLFCCLTKKIYRYGVCRNSDMNYKECSVIHTYLFSEGWSLKNKINSS